jgi:multidrug efflux pump
VRPGVTKAEGLSVLEDAALAAGGPGVELDYAGVSRQIRREGSVPLAISGALLFSYLDLTTINIYSQVGLITLVGLVAKNGILIVEFANSLQERGLAKARALREAAQTRLRPVLMTSAATVFGHLPLVFVSGPGAAARNSIGTILVAGMILGTLFTLFVVPVFYALIAADHSRVRREREVPSPVPATPNLEFA